MDRLSRTDATQALLKFDDAVAAREAQMEDFDDDGARRETDE